MKNTRIYYFCISICFTSTVHTKSIFESISNWFSAHVEEVVTIKELMEPNTNCIIENTKGNITIKTWNKNEFLVEATKTGTEDAVAQTTVTAAYEKNNLIIKTIAKNSQADCIVNYMLLIPKTAAITLMRTDEGSIEVRNCSHPITAKTYSGSIKLYDVCNSAHVSTKKGNITIHAYQLNKNHTILASSEKGNITLEVPEKTAATLYAKTEYGKITTDYPITLAPRTLKITHSTVATIRKEIKGSLGEHFSLNTSTGADIKMTSINGNILLAQGKLLKTDLA